jgi:hypothetical protein
MNMPSAFEQFHRAMIQLEKEWRSATERSGLRHAIGDVHHHVCAALPMIQDAAFSDDELERGVFDRIAPDDRVLAHEAYLSVVALGQLAERAREEQLASTSALGMFDCALWGMLGELEPFVSRADVGLARVLLEGESVEKVAAEIRADGR